MEGDKFKDWPLHACVCKYTLTKTYTCVNQIKKQTTNTSGLRAPDSS